MLSHRLEELASFVRDLGSECTCLIIHEDILIAGSKNGKIVSWNIKDGHEIWSLEVDGPISDIEVSDLIYLTASAELHAIEIENGSLKWTQDIGGSSDLIKVDKESIWVTSSLYEIEVQDYTETTLFKFDKNSKLIKSIVFEERPWFMTIEENDLNDYVTYIDNLNHNKVIDNLVSSQLLFLPLNNSPNVNGIIPGKTYEYIAAQRPILCIGDINGDTSKILHKTNAGSVIGFDDINLIKQEILRFYNLYKLKKLNVDSDNYKIYSRKELASKFANIFDEICK